MRLIVPQLPIKAGWWDAPLALWTFSLSNKHDHAQALSAFYLELEECFRENFINKVKISWESSKPSWRYQNFLSREKDVHVRSSLIYGRSIKWKKTINEMGGNFPGGNFLGGIFPRTLIYKLFFQKNSPRSVLKYIFRNILQNLQESSVWESYF